MKITRPSVYSGLENSMEISMTELQYNDWRNGDKTIWELFPDMPQNEIDFLLTGISESERAEIDRDVALENELDDMEASAPEAYA